MAYWGSRISSLVVVTSSLSDREQIVLTAHRFQCYLRDLCFVPRTDPLGLSK